MSMKNSDTIGNQSRDLPICSAVPQPLRHHILATVPPWKTRYPLCRRLGGPQGWSGQGAENLAPTTIWSPDHPACSESLYRSSYPGPHCYDSTVMKQNVWLHSTTTAHPTLNMLYEGKGLWFWGMGLSVIIMSNEVTDGWLHWNPSFWEGIYHISRPKRCIVIFSLEILEKKKWWTYFKFSNLVEENRIVTYQNLQP
jgi:hypothetical protein